MMKNREHRYYLFGAFRLDVTERILFGAKGAVPLTPKAFDTLLALVENSGHVLGKTELMEKVWPDSFVEENNLAQHVAALRRALSERDSERKYIETVPRRGYRFVVDVEVSDEAAAGQGGLKIEAGCDEPRHRKSRPSLRDVVFIGRAINFK